MRDDLHPAPLFAFVLPGVVPQSALDADLSSFCEVFSAELCLAIPDCDPEEIGFVVLATAVHGEPEGRQPFLFAELAQLDVARQIACQNDAVHSDSSSLSMMATYPRSCDLLVPKAATVCAASGCGA